MGYQITSYCPRCGAPIYQESPWWGILPPPLNYSCNCFPSARIETVTTTNVIVERKDIDIGYGNDRL